MMQISLFNGSKAFEAQFVSQVLDTDFFNLPNEIKNQMWAPGIFKDGHRSLKNFENLRLLVLDIDEGLTVQEAKKLFAPYKCIIASTRNHQKPKAKGNGSVAPACDRYRVILELEEPILNDSDYKATWAQAQLLCPQIDPSCKDSSRFFFPCTEILEVWDGSLFPVTHYAQSVTVQPRSTNTQLVKGDLAKRAWKFLQHGAPDGQWHRERNNFIRECKQNNYSFEEMSELFSKFHTPDQTDLFQMDDVWGRNIKHAARVNTDGPDSSMALLNAIEVSTLIIDTADPEHTTLVNRRDGLIYDVHPRVIAGVLGKNEFAQYLSTNSTQAKWTYNPALPVLSTDASDGLQVYNAYNPPEWLRERFWFGKPLLPSTELPSPYRAFLAHLTGGDTASYEYLLDWMAESLQGRNLTILTTIGGQGIGKGTLGNILQKLHGHTNFVKVRDEIFKKSFNKPLYGKTLVYVDEINLDSQSAVDRIKDVVNDEIEIEAKGVDSISARNYASFYISSNKLDAVRIEGGDRRFSIIELTDNQIIRTPEVGAIMGQLLLPNNIAQLGLYLMHRTIQTKMMIPFRSAKFELVRESTLQDWELYVVEEWCAKNMGKTLPLSELQLDIERAERLHHSPGRRKLEALARKYPEKFKVLRRGNLFFVVVHQFHHP